MIVLAIETATTEIGVALHGPAGPLAQTQQLTGRRHVETLHPAIEAMLVSEGLALSEIGAIAVDVGPGLYTGLRVGMAAAMGLAIGAGVRIVTATSTELLRLGASEPRDRVVPVVDVRRGDLAWELFEDPGTIELGPPEKLAAALVGLGPVRLVGDGALRYRDLLVEVADVSFDETAPSAPSAAVLAALGYERALAGELVAPSSLTARYLRPADAVVNFAVRPNLPGGEPAATGGGR